VTFDDFLVGLALVVVVLFVIVELVLPNEDFDGDDGFGW
jgi:hypothetical protein